MNKNVIWLIIHLVIGANIVHLSVELLNVCIHTIFAKIASHGSKGQWGIQAYPWLRCQCHLITFKNIVKAIHHIFFQVIELRERSGYAKDWYYRLMYHFLRGTFLSDLFVFWLETKSAGISLELLQMRPTCPDWQNNKLRIRNSFLNYNVIDFFFFFSCKGRHILVNAAVDWHIWGKSPHVLLKKHTLYWRWSTMIQGHVVNTAAVLYIHHKLIVKMCVGLVNNEQISWSCWTVQRYYPLAPSGEVKPDAPFVEWNRGWILLQQHCNNRFPHLLEQKNGGLINDEKAETFPCV